MNETGKYLEALDHPLKDLILLVREAILHAEPGLEENIKWNAPNFMYNGADRITMKIYPAKQVQVVFHKGTMKTASPASRLLEHDRGLLKWAANDRAVASFQSGKDFHEKKKDLALVVKDWLAASGT